MNRSPSWLVAALALVVLGSLSLACDGGEPKLRALHVAADGGACRKPCASVDGGMANPEFPSSDAGPCTPDEACGSEDGGKPGDTPHGPDDAGSPDAQVACTDACTLDHAQAECREGSCVLLSCAEGFSDLDMRGENGCECQEPTPGPRGSTCCTMAGGARRCLGEDDTPFVPIAATDTWLGCAPESRDACEPDEMPARKVQLSAYEIDAHEVTQAAYARYLAATGAPAPLAGFSPDMLAKRPVSYVTWREAQAYCQWRGGDLPTDAQ